MRKGICRKDLAIDVIRSLYDDISNYEERLLNSAYQTKDNNFNY